VVKILGYKPQDFIGRPVSDLGNVLTPESFEQAVADISFVLKGVTIHAAIYKFIAKDGTIKIGEVSGSPLMHEGKIIGIISVARDITDRMRMEEALRASTSRQKAILAAVPEIIMEVDNNKVYTWANAGGIEFFGEDVIGKEAAFYFEAEQETYDTVKPLFNGTEDIIYLESWQRRRDGEKRLLAWWCRVLKDESGQVTGALSSAHDITESKRQERALRESEKKYRDLFDFLPIPVYEMDFEANIISANRSIYETFRGTEEDLKNGFKGWQLISPEEVDKSAKNIQRLLQGEQIGGTEYTLRRLDGSDFPAIVISSVIYSDDKPVGLRGAIVDITQIKKAEDDIKLLLKSVEEERNKLAALIGSMTDEVWFADEQKKFTLANPAAIRQFCLDPNDQAVDVERLAESLVVLRPDGSARPVEEAPPLRALSGEVVINQEEIIQYPASGEFRYRQVNAAPVRYADGKIIGSVSVVRDITDSKRANDELRRTSNLLNLIVENIPDMLFLKDAKELRFVRFNRAGEALLGHSRDELLGKNDHDFFPKEQADFFIKKDREVLQGMGLVEIPEESIQTRNKGKRILRTKKVPILDAKGEAEYLLGISEDITDRKRAEGALRESEKRLREAQKMAHLGFWHWDIKTGDVDWSEEVFKIFCLDPKEFTPHIDSILALSPWPEDNLRNQELINRALETHDQGFYEQKFLRPDQSIGYYYSTFQGNYDENGDLFAIVGTVLDITDRKRSEDALRESEALFRKLFDEHAAVKLIIDPDTGSLIDANEAASQYYGWPRERLKAMKITEINTLTPEEIKNEMETARAKKRIHFEFRHRLADGSIRDVAVFSSSIENKGKVLLHSIIHDITERKLAEEGLKETLESLRNAVGTTIQVMVSAVEARDPYTAGHQSRVAELARSIATEMGLSQDKIEAVRMAGPIHDIGKLSIPAEILSKPTKLTAIEFSLIKEHAQTGFEMLKDVESPWPLAQIVYQHHERMDGSGYPRNLKGEEILIEARILAVSDVVESMASHRPYRPALGLKAALEEIEKNRGALYDADAVDACLRLFREKVYKLEGT
jgi:PAS domain S-box-containing protein/putative nucleotidyltransferase with HDIG domain